MAEKDEIETDPAAASPVRAEAVLKGQAGRMAAKLKTLTDAFLAQPTDPAAIAKAAQTLAALARAHVILHQAQAAEDKAEDSRRDRAADKARALYTLNPDEGDETDMNAKDPRLEDPRAMAAADRELNRRLDQLALEVKAQSAAERASGKGSPRGAGQLVPGEPRATTSAH